MTLNSVETQVKKRRIIGITNFSETDDIQNP